MQNLFNWFTSGRSRMPGSDGDQGLGEAKMASSFHGVAFTNASAAHWTKPGYATLARAGFMRNPVVYRCVRLIADSASSIPIVAYQDREELNDHPALRLIQQPNAMQTRAELLDTIVGHLLVAGDAFLKLSKLEDEPRELHALRPDRVRIVTDRSGWTEKYEYSIRTGTLSFPCGDDGLSEILHLKFFHPLDELNGFPPLQAAQMALEVHNSANQWNKALLDNSARPSGALVYSNTTGNHLSDEQFDRLKSELEDGYTGATRAGRPLLLDGGLDWKAMGYSPKDMDFVEGRNAAARDIALAFGVPPMLLGIPGDNTYSNYQEANRALLRQTVLPLIRRVLESLSHWLGAHCKDTVSLTIDEDKVEGLSSEREAVWSRLGKAEFLTDAEKREALGYSPNPPQDSQ